MADEMETDLPVKVETDTDESEHENGCDETEKMEEDEEVNEEKDEDAATDSKDDALCSDPNYMELVNGQIKKRVAREFAKLINEGKLSLSDLDQRSRSFLANLKAEDGVQFARHLGQMITKRPQMEGADDKEEFIKRQLSILRVQLKKQNRDYLQEPVGGPDQEKIDLYISGLPRDMYEDELVPILEQCGRIWALRLMGETKIFGARLDVSQADARGKPEDDCLNKVTEVHVHDMPASMHAEELRTKLGEYGEVKRVSKAGDHAIVFFVENEGAVKAMMALKGTVSID
nr:hypothetical protein BaRGS_018770 [Batillaria attramentaria]